MRILHVLDHSVPLHSGYAFRTLAILREQRALGWQTFHLTSAKQGKSPDLVEEVEGLRFYRTKPRGDRTSRLAGLGELRFMVDLARRLDGVAREVDAGLVHAHSPVLNALPSLRVARRLSIPVIYEVRAFWEDAAVSHGSGREGGLRFRLTRAMERLALRRVDAVTTICDGLRQDMISRGIPEDRITIIPNAVDVDKFSLESQADPELRRRLGLETSRVLGFVGSFYRYEGIDVLLNALPMMLAKAPDLKVLLVGGGPEEAELQRLTERLALQGKVIFAGRVSHADVHRHYDLIDVLVYPRVSIRLTELVTPLKPLEAMAQGRLVAASDVGGHRELIRDGKTGILFRSGRPDALAGTVLELLGAPERWPVLRSAARRFVETERSWRASVSRYRDVYGSVLSSGQRGR